MKLVVAGSSSKGNCYFLIGEKETLMIECGINPKKAFELIEFDTKKIVGCLVSHEHGDHSKYASRLLSAGIRVYASNGTLDGLSYTDVLQRLSTRPVSHGEVFKVGEFKVMAFNTEHDCAEPLGFLIDHPEVGRIVFATDTYFVRYRFKNVTVMMIEANYSNERLEYNIESKKLPEFVGKRIRKSHFEIGDTIKFIKANDNPALRKVVLIHLSDGNGCPEEFKAAVRDHVVCEVHAAAPGKEINLDLF